jgi:thiol:disulfide interchange protein DsbD
VTIQEPSGLFFAASQQEMPWRAYGLATKVLRMNRIRTVALVALSSALSLAAAGIADAKPWWMRGAESNAGDFLPPDVAFRVAASVDGSVLKVRWVIADGYYLYRQKIGVQAESPDLSVSEPQLPAGVVKNDPYLGTQEIYTQQVEATVPYRRFDAGAHPMQIKVTYQGCAEAGLCYPVITKVVFPVAGSAPATASSTRHPWEGIAIIGGGLAFLFAGSVLRKGRKLDVPA